ncbi:hypothetical protein F2Q69_00042215 [Brassica cretica]|uniref:Aspartic peptidase DDI1-type domain-containing protein n=1 Tax=Brassica cretica TaxID=69181 RepID=A0A8S9NUN9_BRACR|nr:hypothetical protein F2Q69_00042215 [Brassica cretica]
MFHQVREKIRHRITLKKSDPGKFVVPCLIGGIDYARALCDMGSSVSILPKMMADHLRVKIKPLEDSFTFFDSQLEFFSVTWENLHGYCKSSMRHADQQVVSDTHRPYFCYYDHEVEVELETEASIDTQLEASIDKKSDAVIDEELETPIESDHANEKDNFPEGTINSWENDYCQPSFTIQTTTPSKRKINDSDYYTFKEENQHNGAI